MAKDEMGKTNLARYVLIFQLIENEPDTWTCSKLGLRFGVTKQSIHRDIQKLRKSGYRILSSQSGYRIESVEKKRQLQ